MTREEKEIIFQHVYVQRKAAAFWWKKHFDLPESEEINDSWRSNQIKYIESGIKSSFLNNSADSIYFI